MFVLFVIDISYCLIYIFFVLGFEYNLYLYYIYWWGYAPSPWLYNNYIKLDDIGGTMRIRDLREDNDITQKELAEYLHIRQNTYSQYENGHRQIPLEALIKLAEYYNTSTDYLLCLTDERKPYKRR